MIPYKNLSEKFRSAPYIELLANQRFLEALLKEESQYLGPCLSDNDSKLSNALDTVFQTALSDVEIKWLHFQSLLWEIENTDEETENFLKILAEKA